MADSSPENGSGEIEDAISFLDRAKKFCSEVSLLLNAVQLLALDFDPTQPFSQNNVSPCFFFLVKQHSTISSHLTINISGASSTVRIFHCLCSQTSRCTLQYCDTIF